MLICNCGFVSTKILSFTQEVSMRSGISTERRKDQRWWLQGKLKRKVFLGFLSWLKDQTEAEIHQNAMQLVSVREVPWEVLGPVPFPLMAKQQAPWHNQLPHLHRSSSFLNLLNPRFPGNGCVAQHLQLTMRCPWAPATCRAEPAMKNERFWGNNTFKLYVGLLKKNPQKPENFQSRATDGDDKA